MDADDALEHGLHDVALDDEPRVHSLTAPPDHDPASGLDTPAEDAQGPADGAEHGYSAAEGAEELPEGETGAQDASARSADAAQSDLTALSDEQDDNGGFDAVSLDDSHAPAASASTARSSSSPSPSPAPTSSPPLSPSLASTAATTIADAPSSVEVGAQPHDEVAEPATAGASAAPPAAAAAATAPEPSPSSGADEGTPKKQMSTRMPTVMQKVVSMTRQRNLPPKSREEEVRRLAFSTWSEGGADEETYFQEKHLQQLAAMHAASREAEKRRRSEAEHRAHLRAASLASAFPAWESAILPNWRAVLHDTAQGRHLRRLWWDGTMPVRWRGRLWSMCIGNVLAVSKGAFAKALERVQKLRSEGDAAMLEATRRAKEDAERTLPALKLFQEGRVMHDDLMELLLAWSVHEKMAPRYPEGLSFPAALLLLNMSPAEAFICLVNLVQKSFLRSFYSDDPEEIEAYYRVFDTLLADAMPKIYANFSSQVVRPSLYLFPWLTTLFVAFLPLDLSTRIFDVFLLEGDSFAFRVALALLEILEPRLFNPNLDELAAVFAAQDRGAVGVVRRVKGLLTADGAVEERDGGVRVEKEDVYDAMGVTEERVFALLDRMEWKEETWARLVERELPEVV
ncbi:hypothetical protein Rhopal_000455-T1 [Rhodotorula paludigena]|uniref:Rab-GAP TBC domain-containing protein n=1 Tax=Rhodotorula paludigena TaxID=86838 RepID=A0AAV5GD35_9BASI|nr:hypothetical protein Rhopal_000455-T1 [Rhodotorula paludigena]